MNQSDSVILKTFLGSIWRSFGKDFAYAISSIIITASEPTRFWTEPFVNVIWGHIRKVTQLPKINVLQNDLNLRKLKLLRNKTVGLVRYEVYPIIKQNVCERDLSRE